MQANSKNYTFYLNPIYWPVWFLVLCLWLVSHLPYRILLYFGRYLGLLIYYCARDLRSIAKTNIELCFKDMDSVAQAKLLKDNFIFFGQSVFESALGWFASDRRLQKLAHMHDSENFAKAMQDSRGCILLSAHFMTLEITGRLFAQQYDFVIIYRAHKMPIVNFLLTKVFRRHYGQMIERSDIRAILKALKQGKKVWYTPDIDAGYYNNVFVPFFGVLASSLTAPARMAKITNSIVAPTAYYRRSDKHGYDIHCGDIFTDFPSDNIKQDITRVNLALEQAIRKHPQQYMWAYKRFKTRPQGESRLYKKRN
jgi:Kdo2-lipid IVA lauroyltransferase/acyltransferase